MVIKKYIWYVLPLLWLTSCTTTQHISKADTQYTVVRKESSKEKQEIVSMIQPYKQQLDAEMNEVVGQIPTELSKQKPESTLGNWTADIMLDRIRQEGYEADFAIVNYGGLRVPYISPGPLTKGELFELSPFDNMLVVVDMPGDKVDSMFLLIAEADGWPVSKGVQLVIGKKKVIRSSVGGVPLDNNKTYKVATLDYVASGGDNMKMFIPLSRVQTGLVFRNVLIEYVQEATRKGIPLTSAIEGRITLQ